MLATSSELFTTLGDPTRRAIFERLCRDGEQTVWMLTEQAGVSQPAVSKHLGVLKSAAKAARPITARSPRRWRR
jgi:DNA-binding transcriptional ArsR family regulator